MNTLWTRGVLVIGLLLATTTRADANDSALAEMVVYGIGKSNGALKRFEFDTGQSAEVGVVRDQAGQPMLGIDAAAYVPGFLNIFAFWTDEADNQNKLVYINTKTSEAAIVADDLEGGRITGAVAVGATQGTATTFDGINDFQQIPHSSDYLMNQGTVTFWFKTDNASVKQGLVSKDSSGYDTGGHLTIYLESSRVKARLQSTSTSHLAVSDLSVASNTWYHVGLTFGPGGMKLYLNGIETDSDPYPGGLGTSSGGTGNHEPIVLGANQWGSGDLVADQLQDFFAGQISQFNLVDAVLTASDLTNSGTGNLWTVFAVQQEKVSEPVTILGQININPNNSPQNEFSLTLPDGSTITRDHLHQNTAVDANGYYLVAGNKTIPASHIHVKPKGNGNQNQLTIDGEVYLLQNSNTYDFDGEMTVEVYNDHIHDNGKAMGHWWLKITSGTILLDDVVATPNRLIQIDHQTGVVNEVMALSRAYDSLASQDGHVLLATSADQVYRLDTINQTETLVGSRSGEAPVGLEFAGSALMCFEILTDRLIPISVNNASTVGSSANVGMTDLGTVVFVPITLDPATNPNGFD